MHLAVKISSILLAVFFLIVIAVVSSGTLKGRIALFMLEQRGFMGATALVVEKPVRNSVPSGEVYQNQGILFKYPQELDQLGNIEVYKSFRFKDGTVVQVPSILLDTYYKQVNEMQNGKDMLRPNEISQLKRAVEEENLSNPAGFYRKFVTTTPSDLHVFDSQGKIILQMVILSYKALSDVDGEITKYSGKKYDFYEFTPKGINKNNSIGGEYIAFNKDKSNARTFRVWAKKDNKESLFNILNSIEFTPVE